MNASAERCLHSHHHGHAAGVGTGKGGLDAPLLAALTGSSLLTNVFYDADRPSFRSHYRRRVSEHKRLQHPDDLSHVTVSFLNLMDHPIALHG